MFRHFRRDFLVFKPKGLYSADLLSIFCIEGKSITELHDHLLFVLDDDEWTSDMESESSDEESLVDSNQDLSDAKGEPDTGVLPPPPDGELSTPALPSLSEVQPKSRNPLPELNTKEMPVSFGDLSDAKGSPDSGVMPPSPDKTLSQPALPGFGEKHPVKEHLQQKAEGATNNQFQPVGKQQLQTPEDKPDVKGASDTGEIPQSPYNIVPVICPSDCILVYPVTAGNIFSSTIQSIGRKIALTPALALVEVFQKSVMSCLFLNVLNLNLKYIVNYPPPKGGGG